VDVTVSNDTVNEPHVEQALLDDPPTSAKDCKDTRWRTFNTPRVFKNQRECIQFVNTGR